MTSLKIDWLEFKSRINQFSELGKQLYKVGATLSTDVETLKKDINSWCSEVVVFLRTAFGIDDDDFEKTFNNAKRPRYVFPAGRDFTSSETIKFEIADLREKTETLNHVLKIMSVLDPIINVKEFKLAQRKQFNTHDKLDFLLQKLYDLSDNKYYSVNYILIQNGIDLTTGEDKELAKALNASGDVELSQSGSSAKITIVGKLRVEKMRKDNVTTALATAPKSNVFVNESRIEELTKIESNKFDLRKLVRLCKEVNSNYLNSNYISVAILGRAIIDHVPPILGLKNFDEISSYGAPRENKSFKDSMNHLDKSTRKVADGILHTQIRRSETLPNETQVEFRQGLDVLLAEIVRVLRSDL